MVLDELSEESGDDDRCVGRGGCMGRRGEREGSEDGGMEGFWSKDVKVVLMKSLSSDDDQREIHSRRLSDCPITHIDAVQPDATRGQECDNSRPEYPAQR